MHRWVTVSRCFPSHPLDRAQIPAEFAYGDKGNADGGIPPDEDLVFDVVLERIL